MLSSHVENMPMAADSPYSPEVLEEAPGRATKLLHGIASVPVVRTQMYVAGMKPEHLIEGRTLLLSCLATPESLQPEVDTDEARAVRAAEATLDEWDEPHFARFGATLRRHFPSAHAYVFRDLAASTGSAAIRGVATFLARVQALAEGSDPARKGSVEQDAQAVALLAERGLTPAERARLQGLVELALGPTEVLGVLPRAESPDARRAKLVALKDWYEEWASTARAVVKKRSHLIRLGLAVRKSPRKGPPDASAPDPA
jgi:hypothetical protein